MKLRAAAHLYCGVIAFHTVIVAHALAGIQQAARQLVLHLSGTCSDAVAHQGWRVVPFADSLCGQLEVSACRVAVEISSQAMTVTCFPALLSLLMPGLCSNLSGALLIAMLWLTV